MRRWPARLILLLLAVAMMASMLPARHITMPQPPRTAAEQRDADLELYEAIIARIQKGEGYHAAAAQEQRARGYPLHPFVTVRMPTLALLIANIGFKAANALLICIWVGACLAWRARLSPHLPLPAWGAIAAIFLFGGITPITNVHYVTLHELWAGGLIALSLGLYRPERWLPSLLAAGCALSLREHSLPFLFLMAANALWFRRWNEAMAWIAVILAFFALLYVHMNMVAAVALASDKHSPGWTVLGGFERALSYIHQTGWPRFLPALAAFPLIILSLFGWLSWRHPIGLLASLTLLGYALIFCLIGRADTFYWGFIIGPLLSIGFVLLRITLPELGRAAWPRQLDLATS